MARTATFHNWGKTYKACSMALLQSGRKLNSIALVDLQEVAEDYLRNQDAQWPHSTSVQTLTFRKGSFVPGTQKFGGDQKHPWYSGQTHDSVAVRITTGNRVTSVHYMPPSPDTGKPQHTETIQNIIGADWAREIAETHGTRFWLPGVQVQLIVGVPYAEKVNEEGWHAGFVDYLADELFNAVDDWVRGGGLDRYTLIPTDNGVKVVKRKHVLRK